jgi:hypothetical protein
MAIFADNSYILWAYIRIVSAVVMQPLQARQSYNETTALLFSSDFLIKSGFYIWNSSLFLIIEFFPYIIYILQFLLGHQGFHAFLRRCNKIVNRRNFYCWRKHLIWIYIWYKVYLRKDFTLFILWPEYYSFFWR